MNPKITVPNFSVGIRLADHGTKQKGAWYYTKAINEGNNWTNWAFDGDKRDPDAVQVHLRLEDGVYARYDASIHVQLTDNGTAEKNRGPVLVSRWASEEPTLDDVEFAFDRDRHDPDGVRVRLYRKEWPPIERTWVDVRIGVQLVDAGGAAKGQPMYTPWSSNGGGKSSWATDPDAYDFDGVAIWLESKLEASN